MVTTTVNYLATWKLKFGKKIGPPYYGLVLVAGRTIARNSCMILSLSLFWRSRTANSCRRSSQKFSRHCRCSSTKDWNHTGGWSLRLFGALPGCGCSAGVSVALALVLLLQVVQLAADTTFWCRQWLQHRQAPRPWHNTVATCNNSSNRRQTVNKLERNRSHTHTYLTALFPGLPRWAGTRKVKPIWILLKQEPVSGSGISWTICKSAPRSRQTTMPAPHHSVFYRPDALPVAQPTASKHWWHWSI